jgi:hypothetical protein
MTMSGYDCQQPPSSPFRWKCEECKLPCSLRYQLQSGKINKAKSKNGKANAKRMREGRAPAQRTCDEPGCTRLHWKDHSKCREHYLAYVRRQSKAKKRAKK